MKMITRIVNYSSDSWSLSRSWSRYWSASWSLRWSISGSWSESMTNSRLWSWNSRSRALHYENDDKN